MSMFQLEAFGAVADGVKLKHLRIISESTNDSTDTNILPSVWMGQYDIKQAYTMTSASHDISARLRSRQVVALDGLYLSSQGIVDFDGPILDNGPVDEGDCDNNSGGVNGSGSNNGYFDRLVVPAGEGVESSSGIVVNGDTMETDGGSRDVKEACLYDEGIGDRDMDYVDGGLMAPMPGGEGVPISSVGGNRGETSGGGRGDDITMVERYVEEASADMYGDCNHDEGGPAINDSYNRIGISMGGREGNAYYHQEQSNEQKDCTRQLCGDYGIGNSEDDSYEREAMETRYLEDDAHYEDGPLDDNINDYNNNYESYEEEPYYSYNNSQHSLPDDEAINSNDMYDFDDIYNKVILPAETALTCTMDAEPFDDMVFNQQEIPASPTVSSSQHYKQHRKVIYATTSDSNSMYGVFDTTRSDHQKQLHSTGLPLSPTGLKQDLELVELRRFCFFDTICEFQEKIDEEQRQLGTYCNTYYMLLLIS